MLSQQWHIFIWLPIRLWHSIFHLNLFWHLLHLQEQLANLPCCRCSYHRISSINSDSLWNMSNSRFKKLVRSLPFLNSYVVLSFYYMVCLLYYLLQSCCLWLCSISICLIILSPWNVLFTVYGSHCLISYILRWVLKFALYDFFLNMRNARILVFPANH